VLAHRIAFSPDQDDSFFQELPASAAVFLLRGEGEPYVSKTANLRRRLVRLLGPPPEQSKRLNLRDRVREVEFTPTGSDFESQFLLYKVLRENFPNTYQKRLRLRPAPLVKLHLENEYPRASVTTRMGKLHFEDDCGTTSVSLVQQNTHSTSEDARAAGPTVHNLYYGPFQSRAAAEKFASDALDFFKMRRCVDDLHPDPTFPGCVYSEMKMCLAPCFSGCTDEDYHSEVDRVQKFFDSAGESLTRELVEQRDRASTDLAFEEAGAIHSKIEKLKPVLAQLPEIVHRIDRLNAIVVQPSPEPSSVALFWFSRATLQGPIRFSIEHTGEPQSMESRLQSALTEFVACSSKSSTERSEHLAILKRWYYRSNRVGEVFFAEQDGIWPLRRIVRGIGRVYLGEKEPRPVSFSATTTNSIPSEPA
jgi:excinuclease ABC subunit C